MARESFKLSGEIAARPGQVFKAWLSAKDHSAFTGEPAVIAPRAGTRHSAYGGYIHGWTLAVDASKRRFTQAWRTTEFAAGDIDSTVTVSVKRSKTGSTVTIAHDDLPEGQGARYQKGWEEHYFELLRKHFAARAEKPKKTEKKSPKKTEKKTAKAKKGSEKKTVEKKKSPKKKTAKKKVEPTV